MLTSAVLHHLELFLPTPQLKCFAVTNWLPDKFVRYLILFTGNFHVCHRPEVVVFSYDPPTLSLQEANSCLNVVLLFKDTSFSLKRSQNMNTTCDMHRVPTLCLHAWFPLNRHSSSPNWKRSQEHLLQRRPQPQLLRPPRHVRQALLQRRWSSLPLLLLLTFPGSTTLVGSLPWARLPTTTQPSLP